MSIQKREERNYLLDGRRRSTRNQKGLSAIAILLFLLFLITIGGVGYFVYKQKQAQNLPPQTTFEHVNLNDEISTFLFQRVPRLYARVFQLNAELTVIQAELERIGELENEYPSGKRIVQAERVNWVNLQKKLQATVGTTEKKAESYYVAYMVNKETGKELINEGLDGLISQIDDVLAISKEETRRLKIVTDRTLLGRLKAIFNK